MNKPVEIEFAVNLSKKKDEPSVFNLLQIRPIVDNRETMTVELNDVKDKNCIINSNSALGNGIIENLTDLVYIKPETFDPI